jgi:hypothetical protein
MKGSLLYGTCAAVGLICLGGCATQHEVKTESEIKPVHVTTVHEIKPIHITIDVNLKVDRELNDFFGSLDQSSPLLVNMDSPVNSPETP